MSSSPAALPTVPRATGPASPAAMCADAARSAVPCATDVLMALQRDKMRQAARRLVRALCDGLLVGLVALALLALWHAHHG